MTSLDENRWETFARKAPESYILTDFKGPTLTKEQLERADVAGSPWQ